MSGWTIDVESSGAHSRSRSIRWPPMLPTLLTADAAATLAFGTAAPLCDILSATAGESKQGSVWGLPHCDSAARRSIRASSPPLLASCLSPLTSLFFRSVARATVGDTGEKNARRTSRQMQASDGSEEPHQISHCAVIESSRRPASSMVLRRWLGCETARGQSFCAASSLPFVLPPPPRAAPRRAVSSWSRSSLHLLPPPIPPPRLLRLASVIGVRAVSSNLGPSRGNQQAPTRDLNFNSSSRHEQTAMDTHEPSAPPHEPDEAAHGSSDAAASSQHFQPQRSQCVSRCC